MTSPIMVPSWNDIVDGRTADDAAEIALARLREAPWLANLGQASQRDDDVLRVKAWPEALRMFTEASADDEHATGSSGILNAPFWLLLRRLDADERLNRQTADASNHALDALIGYYSAVGEGACAHLPPGEDTFETEIALGDYVHRYIQLLFIEIYAGDIAEPRCSYFRDKLGWFLAGLLPCGWEGKWPQGRLRVF